MLASMGQYVSITIPGCGRYWPGQQQQWVLVVGRAVLVIWWEDHPLRHFEGEAGCMSSKKAVLGGVWARVEAAWVVGAAVIMGVVVPEGFWREEVHRGLVATPPLRSSS
jgi:hypothetical protein